MEEKFKIETGPEQDVEKLKAEIEKLKKEIAGLKSENEMMLKLSYNDFLTNLYNRRGFEDVVQKILPEAVSPAGEQEPSQLERRKKSYEGKPITFLLLDIDDFKRLNDTYGHDAGDEVLKKAASFLEEVARRKDIVCRWGGEEFVVAFNGAKEQDIINKFYNKKKSRPEINFDMEIKGKTVKITFSGGLTSFRPGEDRDYADFFERADEALYNSKKNGKNQITRYHAS